MLVDGLLKRQQEARLVFAERFAQFADEQHVERYNRLFATKQDAKLNGAPS
jgi:hypothetical protein